MAGRRQPTALVLLKGKKHMTKAEIAERQSKEVKAPSDNVKAPRYLDKDGKREFNRLAKQLLDVNIMTNLDVDALARFVYAHQMYLTVTNELLNLNPVHNVQNEDADGRIRTVKISNDNYANLLQAQDKLFKQCRQAASDLGLTIASRCRLVVPKKQEPNPPTKEEQLFGGRV